ncbi:MAG: hypothetical protein IE887_08910 [Campylobacterales bacterium]|nr:hypothetical protein [Campylobacterales bacterium]
MLVRPLLCLFFLFQYGCGADYSKLLEAKKNKHGSVSVEETQGINTNNKLLELKYFDINNLDTFYLEREYKLKLVQCIADGICIFEYFGEENIDLLINKIKIEETKIKSVRSYKPYNFKPF